MVSMRGSIVKNTVRLILAVTTLVAPAWMTTSAQAQSAAAPPDPMANPCERACLEGWVNNYLEAMKAHNVEPALFAREIKFTENGIRLPLGGEGLWFDTTGIGNLTDGEYQFHKGSFADFAFNLNIPLVSLHYAVNHGEPESGAPLTFGGEEGFQAAFAGFFVHANAGILHFQNDI